ncbi:hypothetical protein F441_15591 [Phytophthora nicotianae CJ01A1]|uniref:Uncharacterized protein n=2 Tax=Phytophthora nicotianae TaxID=4792 RepID=W2IFP6_PHYNI|nr:hypothetical protein L915_15312 [Phytophthora nicotianae]ETL32168.1 hypothetical protein L916_15203 [Phytophthora nicotianae]ETP08422.1 hypothetical protein F441_15591 [Phytophthora nicotianae CJ01A1]
MGMDPKYCKVTVHPANIKASPPRMRRQTVGDEGLSSVRNESFKRAPPPVPPYKAYAAAVFDNVDEVLEDDTADIAVLSEEEPMPSSRRRAHTTSSMSTSARLSNILNPLSRMTMRWTEQSNDAGSNKATDSSTTSASSTPDLMDTPPPLTTPPPMMDLANSFLDVDTGGSDEITRPTFEDMASLMAGTPPIPAGLTLDMLPTEYETPPIPSHLRDVLLHNQNQQKSLSPLVFEHSDDEESEIDDDDTSSATTDDYGEDPANHSVDIDSIRQTREQAMANFEASLRDPNRRIPRSRTTEVPKRIGGSARNIRGLSSPPRMLSQVIRPRKATVPDAADASTESGANPHNGGDPSVPMYHGQELHLAFKTTTGQITQVQGHPKRRGGHANPFSRRVRCHAVQPYDSLEDGDTLRIIGHTTDGLLRGGDCVSFARTDGTVLRMQKMSKKLTFSNKIDVRAKFIITGIPDRTPVTSTSKFYLQSVYDRKKTVGFLRSRRDNHPGCLAMYVHRNAEEKVEPIQFFKRHPGQNMVFWHQPQQWV